MSQSEASPVVEEVLRFEDLPPDSLASRRAVVRWSDGTVGEALRWVSDEVLVCEGDLIGKTRSSSVASLPPGSRLASVVRTAQPGRVTFG